MASSELLKQIQAGKKLKKTETIDRSAPVLDKPKGGGVERSGGLDTRQGSSTTITGAGPPQLGSLFAGGMPKLKPAGQSHSAKPSTLGKPPTIPKRGASDPPPNLSASARSTPGPKPPANTTSKPPPTPPNRPTPSLPPRLAPSVPARPAPNVPVAARLVPTTPTAPFPPPRKPPPPARTGPPPTILSRPSPSLPSRSESPPTMKAARPVPPRNVPQVPFRPVPAGPGRAPPPPPPRPSSISSSSPTKSAPPPPARKAQVTAPVPPARVRELSEGDSPSLPPSSAPATPQTRSALLPPPSRLRTASGTTTLAPPVRNGVGLRSDGNNTVPPPNYGGYTFEVSDFPAPREFDGEKRKYISGGERGSEFDVKTLDA